MFFCKLLSDIKRSARRSLIGGGGKPPKFPWPLIFWLASGTLIVSCEHLRGYETKTPTPAPQVYIPQRKEFSEIEIWLARRDMAATGRQISVDPRAYARDARNWQFIFEYDAEQRPVLLEIDTVADALEYLPFARTLALAPAALPRDVQNVLQYLKIPNDGRSFLAYLTQYADLIIFAPKFALGGDPEAKPLLTLNGFTDKNSALYPGQDVIYINSKYNYSKPDTDYSEREFYNLLAVLVHEAAHKEYIELQRDGKVTIARSTVYEERFAQLRQLSFFRALRDAPELDNRSTGQDRYDSLLELIKTNHNRRLGLAADDLDLLPNKVAEQ